MSLLETLEKQEIIQVNQKHEIAELFGYETRNKYEILDGMGSPIGFAAEQHKGFGGFLLRQILGHWRYFEVLIFDQQRQIAFKCVHPFRFWFNRFEISDAAGRSLGALQQRFSFFSRKFDVEGERGRLHFQMVSPFFRFWTYKFMLRGSEVARIEKKWSGLLSEGFTDKDKFRLTIHNKNLNKDQRALLLAACLFVDLMYFEAKAD